MRPLCLLALLALGPLGCRPMRPAPVAAVEPAPPRPPLTDELCPPANASRLASVLSSIDYALGLTAEQQQRQVEQWQRSFSLEERASDRLRLALALTMGAPEVQDHKAAQALLRGAPWADHQGSYALLGNWVLQTIEERETSRAAVARLRRELEAEKALRREAEQVAEEARDLQRRLDEIKALETDLHQRTDLSEEEE